MTKALALGIVLVVGGVVWRSLVERKRRSRVTTALASSDPVARASALRRISRAGLTPFADTLLALTHSTADPVRLGELAWLIASTQWEPARDPRVAQLRLWADNYYRMTQQEGADGNANGPWIDGAPLPPSVPAPGPAAEPAIRPAMPPSSAHVIEVRDVAMTPATAEAAPGPAASAVTERLSAGAAALCAGGTREVMPSVDTAAGLQARAMAVPLVVPVVPIEQAHVPRAADVYEAEPPPLRHLVPVERTEIPPIVRAVEEILGAVVARLDYEPAMP